MIYFLFHLKCSCIKSYGWNKTEDELEKCMGGWQGYILLVYLGNMFSRVNNISFCSYFVFDSCNI
jgi:hypothetical protein